MYIAYEIYMNSLDERMDYVLRNISNNFIKNIESQEIIFRRGVLFHDDFFGNLKRIGFFKLNDVDIYKTKLPFSIENIISNTYLEKDRIFHKDKKLQLYLYVMNKEDSFDQLINIYKDNSIEICESQDLDIICDLYKTIFSDCSIRITKIFEESYGVVQCCYLIHFYKNKKGKQHFIVKAKKLDFLNDDFFYLGLANELNKNFNTSFTHEDLEANIEECFKIIKLQIY